MFNTNKNNFYKIKSPKNKSDEADLDKKNMAICNRTFFKCIEPEINKTTANKNKNENITFKKI